jgi:DNA polymerase-3 subunit delta'
MLFKDVVGHTNVKELLTNSYRNNRTAHAQIFLGKEGNGALAIALAYAQYLLCEQPLPNDACGQCSACKKAAKQVHPDIHFSYPTVGSKKISTDFITEWRRMILDNPYMNINQWLEQIEADNKQGNITAGECLSIVQRLSYKASEGRYRIMILWLPEFLGKEGNRLLKLIEEPRPNTIFLLVSEQSDKILNTILSRCQLINFARLDDDEIAKHLSQQFSITDDQAQSIAYLSEGNINKARNLLSEHSNNNTNIFIEWLRVCYRGQPKAMVEWVEGMVSGKHKTKDFFEKTGRKDQVFFLKYALFFLREFMTLQQGHKKIRLLDNALDTAHNMLKVIRIDALMEMVQLFDDMAFHIERNAHPKILFLDASIKMHHIIKKQVPNVV